MQEEERGIWTPRHEHMKQEAREKGQGQRRNFEVEKEKIMN